MACMISLETMRRLLLVVALSVAACGETDAPSPRSACADAWASAVAGRTNDEFVAFFTLVPVFRACTTVAEWTAEYDHYNSLPPSGLGHLGSATEVLGEMCKAPEVADEPLCVAAR